MVTGHRGLLFYSAWPLGYHNPEADRKALAFGAAGWDTVHVAGVGIRNPRVTTLAKAGDRLVRGLRAGGPAPVEADGIRSGSILVVPPRQAAPIRALNARWVQRRLAGLLDWSASVAWIRWPSPELVAALERLRPAGVVYECVDAHESSPGITGRWVPRFRAAEDRLIAMTDIGVGSSPALARRFTERGVEARVVGHGVDLEAFAFAPPRTPPREPATIGFVGTLDYKLDIGMLRAVATARPQWRIRLIGPVQEGFDPAVFADQPNVSVEPPVPYDAVGSLIAGFDASMMPYFDDPYYAASAPLKNLEIMAVGRPAVARPNEALRPYEGLVAFATDPESFVSELERVVAEDSPERARRRRAVAEEHSWRRALDACTSIADEAFGRARSGR